MTSPDDGTSASAMQAGEMDWWELPIAGPAAGAEAHRQDPGRRSRTATARFGFMKMNNLQPPFNNAAIRRALLGAVVQKDYMTAIAGEDPTMWRDGVGIFTPGTDMASDAGMEVLNGPRDMAKVRAAIKEAGYNSEKTVLLAPSDPHYRKAMADVGAAMLTIGRLQRRSPVDGLGHRDRAARKQAAGGQGRLERVVHHRERPRHADADCCISCARPARRRGSAGPTARGSRNCAPRGSMRRTSRRKRRSPPTFSASAGSTCRICRSASGISRWRGRTRSTAFRTGFPLFWGARRV